MSSTLVAAPRFKQVAVNLASALALVVPFAAHGTTLAVSNCKDDLSVGSLREVILSANNTDTIYLGDLVCSTITLQHGEIPVPMPALTITGPKDHTLTIDAGYASRIFHHTGFSSLEIDYLTVSHGKYYSANGNALGGCIASDIGTVGLDSSTVSGCIARTAAFGFIAGGGAIYSGGGTNLSASTVSGNSAIASVSGSSADGGGIFSNGLLSLNYSALSGNSAYGTTAGTQGVGGGAWVTGNANFNLDLRYAVVDTNTAERAAGIYQQNPAATAARIVNSTISGNSATLSSGGIALHSALNIDNSTVAFNSAPVYAGVLAAGNVVARSSIFARNTNTSPAQFPDLYLSGISTLGGSHDLIMSTNRTVPGGTLTSDPRLAPLSNHGGSFPNRIHALSANSPAIDNGADNGNGWEGRGNPFPRRVGVAADIGAYERQADEDELFFDGFD